MIILFLGGGPAVAYAKENTRKAAVSGQFYPSDPVELKKEIGRFLSKAKTKPDPSVRSIIVPHAGYPYSGPVAAQAYKLVEGRKFDSVIIVAFLHRVFLNGVLVDHVDFYETPLGKVPVNKDLVKTLRAQDSLLDEEARGELEEHSLEVQIPFLQETVPQLKIVPIYIGKQNLEHAKVLAKAIAKAIEGKNVLVVATTDLSHFYPYDTAVGKDKTAIDLIEKGDIETLYEAYRQEKAEACGMGPVLTAMLLAEQMGWRKPALVQYANSGDVTGDRSSVVGYGAFAIRGSSGTSGDIGKTLLEYSRAVLKAHFSSKTKEPKPPEGGVFEEKRGVFVTLKKHGHLRGCIGQIISDRPVKTNIREMTLAAALEDPRFPPVTANELDQLDIHISLLTKPKKISSYKEIRLGTDGIIVSHGWKKGVYLPEVATETGWDQKAFFESCALEKAGISPAELDLAGIEVFQTEGFGEKEA